MFLELRCFSPAACWPAEKFGSPSSTVRTQSTLMFGLNEKAIGPSGGSYAAPREYWWDSTTQ